MKALRRTLHGHARLTAALIALALILRAIVPAGYMVSADALTLTIEICADTSGQHLTRQIVVPRNDAPDQPKHDSAKGTAGCPFASLWAAGLDSTTPPALAVLALACILILGLAPRRPPVARRQPFLRPPLRAPPVLA
ncbi:DUF2946 family protein [Novosphingobium sp. Gsoil 351]|uniref:DUF2946 family protein n=1 Tax=Novosphingobium sp. Gsoil 351 TaxID=2675225 RepID=UPI0012B49E42|nr:DUF2946 family protein [Novosphingobium sp. Gsoil 351]QGN54319.1 DUF2946 domain-containing protein [Novosphingobium sp. Gsoil 351]